MVKKHLFNHREKILYGGHALAIVLLFGVLDTQLDNDYFSIPGKFFAIALMGISLFTFHSFYKTDYLRKVYRSKETKSMEKYFEKSIKDMPPPEPPAKYKAATPPATQTVKEPDKFKFVPMDKQQQASKRLFEEFNKPMTKENKDIVPEVPKSLQPKPDHEKYDIPDLSDGIKTPDQLRKEREAKRKSSDDFEVKEEVK